MKTAIGTGSVAYAIGKTAARKQAMRYTNRELLGDIEAYFSGAATGLGSLPNAVTSAMVYRMLHGKRNATMKSTLHDYWKNAAIANALFGGAAGATGYLIGHRHMNPEELALYIGAPALISAATSPLAIMAAYGVRKHTNRKHEEDRKKRRKRSAS